jgi:hypothetical protein
MCRCVTTTLSAQLTFHPESGALHWILTRERDGGPVDVATERHLHAEIAEAALLTQLVELATHELAALEGRAPSPFCD